ncbi:hypothetical protein Q3H59_003035 [Pantoea sp. SORGH_AS 659]|nr:hypothetical protein [Pantoea sp. SORGH_AS_0659]
MGFHNTIMAKRRISAAIFMIDQLLKHFCLGAIEDESGMIIVML